MLAGTPVAAKGTTTIVKAGGSTKTYPGVGITLVKDVSLTITSPDGEDKLIVDKAACSYTGELQKCLISHVSIEKHGTTKPLDLSHGTVYVNLTNERQQLSHSSQQLPPKGILLALKTQIGTYITVVGVIDGPIGGDTK
jgi:hypothetical protein